MSTVDVLPSSQKMTSQQLRKIKKPIIEKRRRERINESLNQLKTLVLEALEKDESQYNKMEKADILEMTVKHLKTLQSRLSATKGLLNSQSGTDNVVINKYKVGFRECADEVHRYLEGMSALHPGVKEHLNVHLNTCSPTMEPQSRDVQINTTVTNNNKADSINRSAPLSSVQIGIPVVNGNGSSSSLVFASPMSHVQSAQGYVPVLISPGSTDGSSSGISLISPTSSQRGGIIPLYSNACVNSGSKSPGLDSTDSNLSVYSSPSSSPPSSPASHREGSPPLLQINQELHHSMPSSYRNNSMLMTHSRMQHQNNMFAKETCGPDMYKYSKEVLIQPCSGQVWRPW